MSMILGALEAAICAAIWVVLFLVSIATFGLAIQWLATNPVATWTKKTCTFSPAKKKWMDDKKRLLAESKAILDREALIDNLQREEDEMAKEVIDAAGLESMAVLGRCLDEHWFEIRQNWRDLSDLLDRYCD
ncbi:hypothetical protein N7519_003444 [Penicillium mononematosum]|uniref:uncharacterized protein n=1 Tax=Penicillium mononematosum TaxID=268346 RepID=UPI00254812AF|nr:uncharacterized protein N7519_003444 [Penicillium mononematosum]KAJ6188536.1 hypothetical protein N7519_003444 [Penicillium mononematosum]